jgi:hypothetical protein
MSEKNLVALRCAQTSINFWVRHTHQLLFFADIILSGSNSDVRPQDISPQPNNVMVLLREA